MSETTTTNGGRCPAYHGDYEMQCEGPNDGHTAHYFTTYVEWECCALCRGEMQPVYDAERCYAGRDEIKHADYCPTLPMTRERAEALLECRCPKECLFHAAGDLPWDAQDELVAVAERWLAEHPVEPVEVTA